MSHVAHLSGESRFLHYFTYHPCFPYIVSHRFLTKNMQSCLKGSDGDKGVGMVRGSAKNGINIFFLIHHFTKSFILLHHFVPTLFPIMILNHFTDRFPSSNGLVIELIQIPITTRICDRGNLYVVQLK